MEAGSLGWGASVHEDFAVDGHLAIGIGSVGIVLSRLVSVTGASAIVSIASIPTCCSSATRSTLRARSGRVGTAIFAMSDTQVGVFRLVLDCIDGFDRIRNVGEVDERAVPTKEILEFCLWRVGVNRLTFLSRS